jgi:ATP adenylyltransferase
METLFSPWRNAYVSGGAEARKGVPQALAGWPGDLGCVFCNLSAAVDHAVGQGMEREAAEQAAGVVWRGGECFICLNAYPYTSGHVLVVPYRHQARLNGLSAAATREMMDLARQLEGALERAYSPQGLNMGLNLGEAAGAGVAGHLHLHVLPRWLGDTNFMTAVGGTRVIPEDLGTSWTKIRREMAAGGTATPLAK